MRKLLYILLLLLLSVSPSVRGEAVAARNYNVEFYDRWVDLPTETLMERGIHFLRPDGNKEVQRDSALLCYTIVANRYYERPQSAAERSRSIQAMNNIGYLYFYHYYDYQQAYNWLQKTLTLADKYSLDTVRVQTLLNLGNLMDLMNLMDLIDDNGKKRGMEYYRQAWQAAVKTEEWRLALVIANNVCCFSDYDGAVVDTIRREMASLPIPKETPLYTYVQDNMQLVVCLKNKDYQQALALCDDAEKHNDAKDTPERYLLGLHGMRAHIYSAMGDEAQSLYWLDQAAALAKKYNVLDMMVEIERTYWFYYRDKGDEAAAHRYQMAYLAKKDSLLNQSKLLKVNEMYFLNQLHEVNVQAERIAQSNRIWRWVVAGLALVILLIGALLHFLHRKNKQLEEDRQLMYLKMQEAISMENTIQKYRNSSLDDNSKNDLAERIEQAMQDTEAICNSDFSRDTLAEMVNTTPTNVSQVLTERLDKNFSQLLSEYRIREACRRIANREQYGQLTIEAIAASVGFKSRTNFTANFKKVTGLTPSQYLREAQRKAQ